MILGKYNENALQVLQAKSCLTFFTKSFKKFTGNSGGSRGGGKPPVPPPPPPAAKFFSISCNFWRKKFNFIPAPPTPRVGAPPVKILDPPLGNDVGIKISENWILLWEKKPLALHYSPFVSFLVWAPSLPSWPKFYVSFGKIWPSTGCRPMIWGRCPLFLIINQWRIQGPPPPWRTPPSYYFSQFHAVLGGNLINSYPGTPTRGLAPPSGKILDPPLLTIFFQIYFNHKSTMKTSSVLQEKWYMISFF